MLSNPAIWRYCNGSERDAVISCPISHFCLTASVGSRHPDAAGGRTCAQVEFQGICCNVLEHGQHEKNKYSTRSIFQRLSAECLLYTIIVAGLRNLKYLPWKTTRPKTLLIHGTKLRIERILGIRAPALALLLCVVVCAVCYGLTANHWATGLVATVRLSEKPREKIHIMFVSVASTNDGISTEDARNPSPRLQGNQALRGAYHFHFSELRESAGLQLVRHPHALLFTAEVGAQHLVPHREQARRVVESRVY